MNTPIHTARFQTYTITNATGDSIGSVSFPSDTRNANFGGVCFYDPITDTFLGDTEAGGYRFQPVPSEADRLADQILFSGLERSGRMICRNTRDW